MCLFDRWVGKIPWSRRWQPTPVFLLGKSHEQRSRMGYIVHGATKSQTWLNDWVLNTHFIYSAAVGHSGNFQFVVVQLLSCIQLFATPWTEALQASLPFTVSQSLLKLTSIESVMPSNHLILCCPLLLLPSVFPSIRVSSGELTLHIRCLPKY